MAPPSTSSRLAPARMSLALASMLRLGVGFSAPHPSEGRDQMDGPAPSWSSSRKRPWSASPT
eukprot:13777536-Alexandrium_andersonii.AAC.1